MQSFEEWPEEVDEGVEAHSVVVIRRCIEAEILMVERECAEVCGIFE